MVDIDSLATLLDTDARYDAAVRAGNNGEVVRLLNETDPGGATVFDDVPVDVFLDIVAGASLSAGQDRRLALFVASGGPVPISKLKVQAALMAMFPAGSDERDDLITAASRTETFGESGASSGTKTVSLNEVRQAVRLVSKSLIVATGQA